MSTESILKVLIMAFAAMFIAAVAWWARKHPNRSKEYPERVRMPKVVPGVGWLFIAVGLLMGLVAFTSDHARDPLPFRIASVAIVVAGVVFVLTYRNFYVAPRDFEVAFRSVFGKEHLLCYSDIARYSFQTLKGQPYLTVKWVNGVRLSLNIRAYDMTPLLRAIDFHQVTGHWPARTGGVSGDVRPGKRPSGN
ncbi:hypothetical protein [Paenarthrobacter sp. JL.01a]|uniref:hypothetical protein n=1 Tax=Paenarthrobacter sp. JL.01a TaxID=2979324 RepID=UPI0021C8A82F|nr:hypothetical protein [Paenarthrobacter sp. JL.01a]UXM92173.1 hypothetical protein N5P29_02290 [Paenarthrobacter sp. JL.01a]